MPRSTLAGKSSARPNDNWEAHARQLVRDLMHSARVTSWKHMAQRLEAIGINEDPKVLANKVNRGRFQATLLLQVMAALQVKGLEGLWNEFPPQPPDYSNPETAGQQDS